MNPLLGVFFHWLGGLASGSFYVPFRGVKKWSWEVYWIAAGVFSWIVAPWAAGFFCTKNLIPVLAQALSNEPKAVLFGFLFGMMWGAGGLTFGLTMRYLGMSLGMAIALSYCTVFGTIMPPIVAGTFKSEILGTDNGIVVLLGLGVCVLGIIIAAIAGTSKEREMSEDAKKAAIKEFSFVKGLLVATFSGIMSAGMSYGMNASQPIADLSVLQGTPVIWSQLPRLCVILAGGFLTNFLWCMFLITKNKTGGQFLAKKLTDDGKVVSENADNASDRSLRVPMIANYIFCAIAGTTWYLQFFFYSLGETQMGIFNFSSWPLHMASIMIFSSLWGLALGEWKGSSKFTKTILGVTLLTLIFSTIVIGYGTNIGKTSKERQLVELSEKVELEKDVLTGLLANQADSQSPVFQKHLNAILADAGEIAKYDEDAFKNNNLKIVGLASQLEKVNKLLVAPDDKLQALLAEPEKNLKQLPVKGLEEIETTKLAKEIADTLQSLRSNVSAEKLEQLANAVNRFVADVQKAKKTVE